MATSNPAANEDVYGRAGLAESPGQVMTVAGSVLKTSVLVVLLMVAAGYSWMQFRAGPTGDHFGWLITTAIGGLVTAVVTIFFPKASPFTAPLYAVLEGLFLGTISAIYEARFQGIMIQAVGLSIGVLVLLLVLYGTGLVRATEKFKIGIIAATGAVCLVYLVTLVLSLFGTRVPFIHEAGPIGIGFSVVVVAIAALNLILDFDFIETGSRRGAPKYMEWYAGFSLLVTLIWMYLEILRLLSKLKSRD
jgi:uncharacterized YccA/Bax inhibitor family protein